MSTPTPANIVDLRSDTVTRPTPAMRRAMAEAEVGDDVYSKIPSVNRLEKRAAENLRQGSPRSLSPPAAMGNLIAIKVWTHHGDEVICEERSHVNLYETRLDVRDSRLHAAHRPAPTTVILTWQKIEAVIRPRILLRFANRARLP